MKSLWATDGCILCYGINILTPVNYSFRDHKALLFIWYGVLSAEHLPRKQRSITTRRCWDIQMECRTNFNTQQTLSITGWLLQNAVTVTGSECRYFTVYVPTTHNHPHTNNVEYSVQRSTYIRQSKKHKENRAFHWPLNVIYFNFKVSERRYSNLSLALSLEVLNKSTENRHFDHPLSLNVILSICEYPHKPNMARN